MDADSTGDDGNDAGRHDLSMVGRTVFVWFNTLKVTGCKFWYAINADRFWTT